MAFSPFLLIGFGIVLVILLHTIHPVLALALAIILIVGFAHRTNIIAALIDTELSGLIGTPMNFAKKDNSIWIKAR